MMNGMLFPSRLTIRREMTIERVAITMIERVTITTIAITTTTRNLRSLMLVRMNKSENNNFKKKLIKKALYI